MVERAVQFCAYSEKRIYGELAQLVEHQVRNLGVRGSNPLFSTTSEQAALAPLPAKAESGVCFVAPPFKPQPTLLGLRFVAFRSSNYLNACGDFFQKSPCAHPAAAPFSHQTRFAGLCCEETGKQHQINATRTLQTTKSRLNFFVHQSFRLLFP